MYWLAGLAWSLTNLWLFMSEDVPEWVNERRNRKIAYNIGNVIGCVIVAALWPLHLVGLLAYSAWLFAKDTKKNSNGKK